MTWQRREGGEGGWCAACPHRRRPAGQAARKPDPTTPTPHMVMGISPQVDVVLVLVRPLEGDDVLAAWRGEGGRAAGGGVGGGAAPAGRRHSCPTRPFAPSLSSGAVPGPSLTPALGSQLSHPAFIPQPWPCPHTTLHPPSLALEVVHDLDLALHVLHVLGGPARLGPGGGRVGGWEGWGWGAAARRRRGPPPVEGLRSQARWVQGFKAGRPVSGCVWGRLQPRGAPGPAHRPPPAPAPPHPRPSKPPPVDQGLA